MKKTIKVTISDFDKIAENLADPAELSLYQEANGKLFEAEIEHDGYAVVDLPSEQYIELAPNEYQVMITEWKKAGHLQGATLETMSDPADDTALLYRVTDSDGLAQPPQSLPKALVRQLAEVWFGKAKSGLSE